MSTRGDDEVTREVDPNWLARLRVDASSNGHDPAPPHTEHDTEHDTEQQPELEADVAGGEDHDHTIGNADLLEQVRAAVRDARGDRAPTSPSPQPAALSFPPPDPTSPVHSAKAAPVIASPEARWQPPPRLKPISPAPAPALLADSSRPTRSKRALVVVVAVAVVAALVAGVIIGRSGSSDPTPGDDTVVTTGDSTPASSVPGSASATTEVGS